ncbi:MAG: tRNA pseudouridine(55) synthase TruB [Gammaproteobacteria bacterium]|nr:MAG: tRNA pseudouridine(55) synthase TruB [Gammaproteobacteria bacterium]
MGRRGRNKGRKINGIFLLNKPIGISSNQALQRVKRMFNAAKAGHTGSLDPLATGMLPICLGEATKFSQYLLDSDKRYQVQGLLGIKTETADAEGAAIATSEVKVSEHQLISVMENYRGDIEQIPSMYSAIKVDGQPLYKLAREGITIERKPRPVTIHELELLSFDTPYVEMDVYCSKGTYIRNLIEDIGDDLECGAHVTKLHRSQVGPYQAESMFTFEELEALLETKGLDGLDEKLLPVYSSVAHWPEVVLDTSLAFYVQQGQPIQISEAPQKGGVRLMTDKGEFLGIGEINEDGMVAPKRLISQQT